MNRFILSFAILAIAGLAACKNEKPEEEVYTGPIEQTDPDLISDTLIYFTCNDITQEEDEGTHFEAVIHIATNEAKVGDVEDCSKISKAQYADFNIPEEAVTAIGNEELLYYVIRTSPGKLAVRRGMPDGEGGFNYRAIATFTPGEMSANPDINQTSLVGSYAGSIPDANMSYLLFVGLSKKVLTAQLFRMEGDVPRPDQLIESMRNSEPELLRNFIVNMSTLTFESSTGTGKFIPTADGGMQVRFDAIMTPEKEPLVLDRIQMAPVQ
ncbi:MAG: hypothetical protein GYB31_06705 [Bacteroidetes bacterium]|nr:hypothetical protein [Bacteroidota bacterium]